MTPEEKIAKKNRIRPITVMDKTAFAGLATHSADVCVSIYLGTDKPAIELDEQVDRIILKDALREARSTLEKKQIRKVIEEILEPAEALLEDEEFWHLPTRGLAFFLTPDTHSYCVLPYAPGNAMYVQTNFVMIQLAPMLNLDDPYFVLQLNKNAGRLYRGNQLGLELIGLPGVAQDPDDIRLYFTEVNKALWHQFLGKENKPLLLAGIDYELAIYREVNSYPYLLKAELNGNFDLMPLTTLFHKVQPVMDRYFEDQRRKAVQKDLDHGTAPVTAVTQEVIQAANEGKVAQLFVARGSLDANLANQAVVQTILHGGEVFLEDADKMPLQGQLAAVLRYA